MAGWFFKWLVSRRIGWNVIWFVGGFGWTVGYLVGESVGLLLG